MNSASNIAGHLSVEPVVDG